uniref:Chemosensory protein 4 n=1 Tax=Chrysopa pallens TaxID=417485 RepID=A0A191US27_CHRPA|nr:chemosensory protein 4 [Chrysopa pallens]
MSLYLHTILVVSMTIVILNNSSVMASPNRYIEQQLNCALDQGPCDKFGLEIREYLPDVIGRSCEKCTPQQVAMVRRLIRFIQTQYPEAWHKLLAKYGKKKKYVGSKA